MAVYNWFLTNPFGTGPRTIDVIYLGHTGGGITNLDGEPTWGSTADGTQARFVIESNVTASLWQLIASNHIDDPINGWKRPLDYDGTLNAKVWLKVAVYGTGGGGPTQELIDVVMAVNVPAYVMVTVDGYLANSSNLAHYGKVVGMTQQPYNAGFVASLVDDDEVTNSAWSWSPGQKIFLNGTSVSATPPSSGWSQLVGVARNANIVVVQLRAPVLL